MEGQCCMQSVHCLEQALDGTGASSRTAAVGPPSARTAALVNKIYFIMISLVNKNYFKYLLARVWASGGELDSA